jgi:predicted acylesterase/phospholipase RssA
MVSLTIGGGSFKGIAYLGALEYLYKNKLIYNIKNYYGTSVGSIIGVFYLIGYTPFEILKFILDINLEDFWDFNLINIDTNYSLLSDLLFIKIKEIFSIKENVNITLNEFYIKTGTKLNIFATSLTSRKNVCFNYETYPDLKVLTAIQASCSIPFIFPPVIINEEYFIDGCIKCIDGICSQHVCSQKIHFVIKGDYNTKKINSFLDYLHEVINSTMQNEDIKDTEHTIKIKISDEYNNKLNFNDILKSDKLKLFYQGVFIAKEQFEKKIVKIKEQIDKEQIDKEQIDKEQIDKEQIDKEQKE